MRRLPLALFIALAAVPAAAADNLQDGIAAFNRMDYGTATSKLQARVKEAPEDSVAHYYLGCAYAKTNQTSRATAEYSFCIQLNNNTQVTTYARTALSNLQPSHTSQFSSSPPAPTGAEAFVIQNQHDELVEQLTDQLMKANEAYLDRKRQDLSEQTQRIQERVEQDIQEVPSMVIYMNAQIPNPEYGDRVKRLRQEADRKIDAFKKQVDQEEQRLRADARKKAEAQLAKQK